MNIWLKYSFDTEFLFHLGVLYTKMGLRSTQGQNLSGETVRPYSLHQEAKERSWSALPPTQHREGKPRKHSLVGLKAFPSACHTKRLWDKFLYIGTNVKKVVGSGHAENLLHENPLSVWE